MKHNTLHHPHSFLCHGAFRGKAAVLAVLVILGGQPGFAGGSGAFTLDPVKDGVIGGTAAAAWAAGTLVSHLYKPEPAPFGWFDETGVPGYSSTLDKVGTLSSIAGAAALPFLLDRIDLDSSATVGVMYAEALAFTAGLKDGFKTVVGRPRPYLNRADTPADVKGGEDRYDSFPSGHTAVAFMTASFVTTVYSHSDAPVEAKWLVGTAAFGLAGATAALRVASGCHYPADVAAGALLGAMVGVGVPWLHLKY